MTNIIDFFIRHKNTLLFLFLLLISLALTFQAHSYQKSKFISSANTVTGGIYEVRSNVENYFGLKESNQRLINENKDLREKLLNTQIKEDQSVITSKGIVGVVEKTSKNFSRVISMLNSNVAVSAQLKNSEHFGTLRWSGGNPNIIELSDVPRLAEIHEGDTIITNGRS